MKEQHWTDPEILTAMASGDHRRINAALQYLCLSQRLLGAIRKQLNEYGASDEQDLALLNAALMYFYTCVKNDTYDPAKSGIHTFIVNKAVSIYLTSYRSEDRLRKRHAAAQDNDHILTQTELNPYDSYIRRHRKRLLAAITSSLGERCHRLLQLYVQDFSHDQIAEQLGYRSRDVVKVGVSECKKRLYAYLQERRSLLNELLER